MFCDGGNLHASGDTSQDTDGNGEKNVGSNVLKKQSPVLLVVAVALTAVLAIVGSLVRSAVVTLSLDVTVALNAGGTTTTALVGTEAGKFLHDNSLPLADKSSAFLLLVHGVSHLGLASLDLANHQLSGGSLDELDLYIGNAVDEDVADFDDVELDHDELQGILLALGNGRRLHAEAKAVDALRLRALEVRRSLRLSACEVRTNSGDEAVCERVGVGIEFKVVEQQAISAVGRLDGEVQLQMARDVVHDDRLSMVRDANGASRALELQVLGFGGLRNVDIDLDSDGKGRDDIVVGG